MPPIHPSADRPAMSTEATAAVGPASERFQFHEFDDDASLSAVNGGQGLDGREWEDWLDQLQQRLVGERAGHWLAWTEHPGRRHIRERYVRTYFQRPGHTVAAHEGRARELWPLPHHDDDALDTLHLNRAEWDHYLGELGRALAAGRRSIEWLDDPRRARLKQRYRAALPDADAADGLTGAAADQHAAAVGAATLTGRAGLSVGIGRLGTGLPGPRPHGLTASARTMRGGARPVTGSGRGLRRVINSSDPVEARKPPAATFNEAHRIQYVAAVRDAERRWF